AYLASKAALDKFTEVAAVETMADGVTFTTIHMPLVRTPMIAPTGRQGPSRSPEWAAALIVRALVERPRRIDVPLGTVAEFGALLAPKVRAFVLHQYYRAIPDSPAAKGAADAEPPIEIPAVRTPRPSRRSGARRVTGTALRRAVNLVPGVYW